MISWFWLIPVAFGSGATGAIVGAVWLIWHDRFYDLHDQ